MGADAKTGQIWVGGQWPGSVGNGPNLIGRGENYGWSVYEGNHPFYLERKSEGRRPSCLPRSSIPHAEVPLADRRRGLLR